MLSEDYERCSLTESIYLGEERANIWDEIINEDETIIKGHEESTTKPDTTEIPGNIKGGIITGSPVSADIE